MKRNFQYIQYAAIAVLLVFAAFNPAYAQELMASGGALLIGNMSPSQARVIDPILSNVAQGFKHNQHIGHALFPRIPVAVSGGQILEFGKESFRLYNSRRTPGSGTKRITTGYLGKPYALVQDALEGKVAFEHMRDANRVPGVNLGSRAVNTVMSALSLTLEYDQAQLARDANNYDVNHKIDLVASQWTNDANNPIDDINTGREAIRSSVGVEPNTLVLSAKAFNAAKNNANVTDRFKYTSKESITAEMLANLWELDRVEVGKAVAFDDNDAVIDIWGADAILAYVPISPSSMEEPSFGYTYAMEGHPLTELAYQDRNAKSWIYPVTYERKPVLTGIVSGYLMQNVG